MSTAEANPFLVDTAPNAEIEIRMRRELIFLDLLEIEGLEEFCDSQMVARDFCAGEDILQTLAVGQRVLHDRLQERGLPATEDAIDSISGEEDKEVLQEVNDAIARAADMLHIYDDLDKCEMDNRQLIKQLLNRKTRFKEAANTRHQDLEVAKERFAERMHYAIDEQGLPLTHAQLNERLKATQLFFADPLVMYSGGVVSEGTCRRQSGLNIVHINIDSADSEEMFTNTVYHELLHSVSGSAAKRLGLRVMTGEDGLWADEAMTDLWAALLLDEEATGYRFDSDRKPLWQGEGSENVKKHFERKTDLVSRSYLQYKQAFIAASSRIPSKVLADMYFKRDGDPLEEDQRAGTHAEREFQRTLKRLGGEGRIAAMRQINQLFKEAVKLSSNIVWFQEGEAQEEEAQAIARQINEYDRRSDAEHFWEKRKYDRATSHHTRRRQARIARARRSLTL